MLSMKWKKDNQGHLVAVWQETRELARTIPHKELPSRWAGSADLAAGGRLSVAR